MATIHLNQSPDEQRSPADRSWPGAFGAAVVWHIVVIAALASFGFQIQHNSTTPVETRWSELPDNEVLQDIQIVPQTVVEKTNAGGTVAQTKSAALFLHQQPSVTLDTTRVLTSNPSPPANTAPENLAEKTEGYFLEGQGDGDADGTPGSFFGNNADGKRIVYVIDRSLSMNHPHDSTAGTRFRRLKLELVKSIGQMSGDMYFHIIFFSDGPTAMPAQGLKRATNDAKQRYLRWMARIPAGGQTDPRGALVQALRLQPDVIHFLTDGSFTALIEKEMRRLVQKKTSIHTYTFGDPAGEALMKWIARANGGEYHFVP